MRNYPAAPRQTVVDEYFGIPVEDPYRYLEDPQNPETRALIAAENAYTKAWFDARTDFSAAELEKELRSHPQPARLMGFEEADGMHCAGRSVPGGQFDVVLLNDDYTVRETLMNDEMTGNRMHVYSAVPCPGHPGVFAVRGVKHGAPRCCCVVYSHPEKKILAELDGMFTFAWSEDGKYIYYSDAEVDRANNRNINRVRRFDWQANRLDTLYTHEENAVFIDVLPAPEGWLLLAVKVDYSHILMLSLSPQGKVTRLNAAEGDYGYLGDRDGLCYFKTDERAPRGRVAALPFEALGRENALIEEITDVIPEGEDLLSAAGLIQDGFLTVRENHAVSRVLTLGKDGSLEKELPLPDAYGCAEGAEVLKPSDEGRIFLSYSSFMLEDVPMVFNEKDRSLRLLKEAEETAADDIAVDQQFVTARDGQRILCYIVRLKEQKPDGRAPAMLYGYGGYAVSSHPWPENAVTAHKIVDWVRKGRLYVHCILRGGSEYGETWHQAGMKDTKKNAFYDFIDIAKYLVQAGWTTADRIVATGLSNGGLLMTAIATLAPECFGTVIASVPHTDMLRFRNDDRGMMYVTEYGDPLESKAMFEYMRSYSPYHNIRPGQVYPRMYVQTGEKDNNVPCYHGEKFAVRMQAEASQEHPVLLEVLPHGSHNRGVGDEYWLNIAQIQTFIEICLQEAEGKNE